MWALGLISVRNMALIVKNAVRELAKAKDMRISSETFDALDKMAQDKVNRAMKRATDNGRKTIKACDI
jgi:histone H3/H4